MVKVGQAASSTVQRVLIASDGFAAYPKVILNTFYTNLHTSRVGRPRHIPWPNLHIVQVVKSRSGKKLKEVSRRVIHGCQQALHEIITQTQGGVGKINTAFIERLNATFR